MNKVRAQMVAKVSNVCRRYTDALMGKRNVIGCGVGFKIRGTEQTEEIGVTVSVVRKEPKHRLSESDMVPPEINGVITDVIETGVVRALSVKSPKDSWRPAPPGVSIAHYKGTAGTLGCLVRRRGQLYILSNSHVLAAMNEGKIGDPILQPGPADNGDMDDQIGTLADYVPLRFKQEVAEVPPIQWSPTGCLSLLLYLFDPRRKPPARPVPEFKTVYPENKVDAALAKPISPDMVTPAILDIGTPKGIGEALLGTKIRKSGRTTGVTEGMITQVDVTMEVDFHGKPARFAGQIVSGPMSKPGDSGSLILNEVGQAVGLLFAGSDAIGLINPIEAVLEALDIELVTR